MKIKKEEMLKGNRIIIITDGEDTTTIFLNGKKVGDEYDTGDVIKLAYNLGLAKRPKPLYTTFQRTWALSDDLCYPDVEKIAHFFDYKRLEITPEQECAILNEDFESLVKII